MTWTWGKARKKPIEVEFRHVNPNDIGENGELCELIHTREGTIVGHYDQDYIIMGVEGELYPIKINIFNKTYDIIVPIESDTKRIDTPKQTKKAKGKCKHCGSENGFWASIYDWHCRVCGKVTID